MLYNRCQRGIMNGAILCRMEEYNMTLHEYIEDMRGKRIAIIGIGVSNTPLVELLLAISVPVSRWASRRSIWSSWAVSCIWARTI